MNIRRKTENKVFHYIEEHRMISPQDRIAAGISGGADSVCLLFLLLEYAKKVPLSLAAVHVNHGIRPEAEADADYVEELCRREGIPFFLTVADVHGLALEEKCSEEDMGRRVRYEAFRQAAEKMGGVKIAVAHNSNDNAETMLFHLFRGSGLKGLGGIAPIREEGRNQIIRPILCLERDEVEEYLRERGILWRTDETNQGDGYRRNRIRHHILPYAEQEVASGVVGHMSRTADMLRETESYLEQQTAQALEQCMAAGENRERLGGWQDFGETKRGKPQTGRERYAVEIETFLRFHKVIQKRMLLTLLEALSPTGKDIFQVHIRDTLTLFVEEGNRSIHLPYGIEAWRQYGEVIIERREKADRKASMEEPWGAAEKQALGGKASSGRKNPSQAWQQTVPMPSLEETTDFFFVCDMGDRGKMKFSLLFMQKGRKVPRNQYTKWFDYDKIKESLAVRSRRPGDFLTIADGTGKIIHKSLKEYMITEKIPRPLRDEIPVVAAGSHVLWLTGWRISEYFKVGENTKRVLQVELL